LTVFLQAWPVKEYQLQLTRNGGGQAASFPLSIKEDVLRTINHIGKHTHSICGNFLEKFFVHTSNAPY